DRQAILAILLQQQQARAPVLRIQFRDQPETRESRVLGTHPAGRRLAVDRLKRCDRRCLSRLRGLYGAHLLVPAPGDSQGSQKNGGEASPPGQAGKRRSAHAAFPTTPSNGPPPSEPPWAASIRFSGCGIRPRPWPFSFMTPAMSLIEPFGFVPSA